MSLYSCARDCGVKPESRDGDMQVRAAMRCSLPGFDPDTWDSRSDRATARHAESLMDETRALFRNAGLPFEHDLDLHGCPWGWACSVYASSVLQYAGTRDADSPRRQPSNRMLWLLQHSAERPTEILDAVATLEAHEDGAFALFHEVRSQ